METTATIAEQPIIRAHEYCTECGAVMTLARVIPGLGALPELGIYRCPRCGNVFTWASEPNGRPI
jgi:ribosomal protein S27AE